jgi:hypothetical protein
MPWTVLYILFVLLIYLLYWFLIEPIIFTKSPAAKRVRLQINGFTTAVFLSVEFAIAGVEVWVIILFFSLISMAVLISATLVLSRKEEQEEFPMDLKERDLILWEGEAVEIRSIGKHLIRAISENGEFHIPLKMLTQKGFRKLRKVLPKKVVFSLFFPLELYVNLTRKLQEFLKASTNVLVSPLYTIEFVSIALNEVEIKVTFFTEDTRSENQFWEEFFAFIEKEQLSINRLVKHGETESYRW